uniref:Uncharacterized protein n=1 Tax=Tanacetum cinerariifolium TaxID=118510 RepID=A0A699KV76_TANCI|nr:hypothetical protein [Tanacetum cinerariifolium]
MAASSRSIDSFFASRSNNICCCINSVICDFDEPEVTDELLERTIFFGFVCVTGRPHYRRRHVVLRTNGVEIRNVGFVWSTIDKRVLALDLKVGERVWDLYVGRDSIWELMELADDGVGD